MKLYAHKGFVGTVEIANEDGFIEMFYTSVPYKKGEVLFTDMNGNTQLLTQSQIEDNFVEVQLIDKVKRKEQAETDREEYRRLIREHESVDY